MITTRVFVYKFQNPKLNTEEFLSVFLYDGFLKIL